MTDKELVKECHDFLKQVHRYYNIPEESLDKITQSLLLEERKLLFYEHDSLRLNGKMDVAVVRTLFVKAFERRLWGIAGGDQEYNSGDIFRVKNWKESTEEEAMMALTMDGKWVYVYTVFAIIEDEPVTVG